MFFNLCDFDQTLFFTRKALVLAYQRAFEDFNHEITAEELLLNEGKSIDYIFEKKEINCTDRVRIKSRKKEIYRHYYSYIEPNFTLLSLDNKIIVSNASVVDIQHILDWFNVYDILAVYGRENIRRLKPAPDGFLTVFEKYGLEHRYTVYDDQEMGLDAAKQAATTLNMTDNLHCIKVTAPESHCRSI